MFFALAILLFAAADFLIGWWSLPLIGLILGLIGARRRMVALQVALAAVLAWALLFAWTAMQGNLGPFMQALALSMKLAPARLLSATALLPMLLAGLAARLGAGMRRESVEMLPHKAASKG